MCRKTWNEFWGEFFFRRFVEENPEREGIARRKAEWIWKYMRLSPGCAVLDLGCGSGMYDIHLARMGARVIAVDRLQALLALSRERARHEAVTFLVGDLRTVSFEPDSFDSVTLFDTVGLMSKADDELLIGRMRQWLRRGGRMAVDSPSPPKENQSKFSWQLPDGLLELERTYEPATRILHQDFVFTSNSGEMTRLYDPYDPARQDHNGVLRYLYSREELAEMMRRCGFSVELIPHYMNEADYAFAGA